MIAIILPALHKTIVATNRMNTHQHNNRSDQPLFGPRHDLKRSNMAITATSARTALDNLYKKIPYDAY
jgi:hypothetical protein